MNTPAIAVTPDLLGGVGYAPDELCAATTVMVDHHFEKMQSRTDGVEVMPLADALVTYPWLQELMFSLIDPQSDEILRRAFESSGRPLGTFTWVHDGVRLDQPLQSFGVMTVPQERQFVHDITVIGEGAVLDSLSGSVVTPAMTHGTHVSISETFISKNAHVRSLDVERWGSGMQVYSYSGTRLAEGAASHSVSIAVSGLSKHISTSVTEVAGDAVDSSHSVVFAPRGTHRSMTSTVKLLGEHARAEQIARMVSEGGEIINHSTLVGEAPYSSGFLECDGLMLSEDGFIDSVPSLQARTDRAELSHEASVGMIDQDKLNYLMATNMDEDSARDLIVQGFLDVKNQAIPDSLKATVADLIDAARTAEM